MSGKLIDGRGLAAARTARGPLGDFERMAANVVRRLTGADVVLQDNGSRAAMPDLRVERADGSVGYGEVVTDFETSYAQVYEEIRCRGGQIPLRYEDPRLDRIWFVTVSGACQVKALTTQVPAVLAGLADAALLLEQPGVFDSLVARRVEVAELAARGVVDLLSRPAGIGEAGAMLVYPEGVSGPADPGWEAFSDWLENRLFCAAWADVRRKLAATGAVERHVFVGVTFSTPGEVFFALAEGHRSVPPAPPRLPEEVTHVWVMPAQGGGRCLAWFPSRGWLDAARHWTAD